MILVESSIMEQYKQAVSACLCNQEEISLQAALSLIEILNIPVSEECIRSGINHCWNSGQEALIVQILTFSHYLIESNPCEFSIEQLFSSLVAKKNWKAAQSLVECSCNVCQLSASLEH